MNKITTGLSFLSVASSTKILFTQSPESIPGNFTTYQYDLVSKEVTQIATGDESSYTAWDFPSGAAVCGNTYYAAIDDSIIDWGLAAISLETGHVDIYAASKHQMPTMNLLHNLWCDPSGADGSLLTVQSVTQGDPVFGLYKMEVKDKVTQTQIGEYPYDPKKNYFVASDTEFQATPDRSQVWANFGSSTTNSGNLHIMETNSGSLKSYAYPAGSGYPYSTVPLKNDASSFLVALNNNGVEKGTGSLEGDSVSVSKTEDSDILFTGSQPWTVDATSGKVYTITNEKGGQQWLEIFDATSGDLIDSVGFNGIVDGKGYVGGLALL